MRLDNPAIPPFSIIIVMLCVPYRVFAEYECLDRLLIWNERHLRSALGEFIRWYDHGRVHRGLNGIPDPDPA